MIEKDIIIVGGGPAGAACAWRLKQHHLDPLILDKADFPRVKPCAGWLTPNVFELLETQPDNYPYGLTHFDSFKISLREIKFRLPTHQYAIRRVEFDAWLLDRTDVEIRQHQVRNIEKTSSGYLIDGQFRTKVLIGAGGTHCPVRQILFKPSPSEQQDRLIIAKEEEFQYPISDEDCHLWFFENGLPGYAWYIPKTNGYVNVGIGASAAGLKKKGKTLNTYWSQLVEKLASSQIVSDHPYRPLGYSYYLRGTPFPPQVDDALLIGDALGLATRDMGEGIAPAIQSGLLAADAIIQNKDFQIHSIPRFSFPSLLRLRP
jgi:flavin-dependent dehydrogenase